MGQGSLGGTRRRRRHGVPDAVSRGERGRRNEEALAEGGRVQHGGWPSRRRPAGGRKSLAAAEKRARAETRGAAARAALVRRENGGGAVEAAATRAALFGGGRVALGRGWHPPAEKSRRRPAAAARVPTPRAGTSHPRCVCRAQTPETDAFGVGAPSDARGASARRAIRALEPPVERRARHSIAWRDAASSPLQRGTVREPAAAATRAAPRRAGSARFSPRRATRLGGGARRSRSASPMPPPTAPTASAASLRRLPAFPSHFYAFAPSRRPETARSTESGPAFINGGGGGARSARTGSRDPAGAWGDLGARTPGTEGGAPTERDPTMNGQQFGSARVRHTRDAAKRNRHL